MKLATTGALVLGLLSGCIADPVSGGDSLSGGSGSDGSGSDGSGSGGSAGSESGDPDSGMDDGTGNFACMTIPGSVETAYQAALSTGLTRVSELETRMTAAVGGPEVELDAGAELRAQLAGGLRELSVVTDWIACEFTDEFAAQSLALCGVDGGVQACEGPHLCAGECTGALYQPGPTSCATSCIGPCELEVAVACAGWCSGSCSSSDGESDTEGVCDGDCEGACAVGFDSCEGTCAGGCFDESGDPGSFEPGPLYCAGTCSGTPTECLGRVSTASPSDACNAIADFAAVAGPACETPDLVYSFMFGVEVAADQGAQDALTLLLLDARPTLAELLAVEHQAEMMLDTLVPPPCDDPQLESDHSELTQRLETLLDSAAAWALPMGSTPWEPV